MVEIKPGADSTMQIKSKKGDFLLRGFHDYVISTQRTDSTVVWKNEELIFAGFGVVAPEYNWNDYENLNVKDKIVIVLVNDPGFGGGDSTFFRGNTMTYYGRWTYKFEEAARQGAKGCFVIHNTVPAGYPFAVMLQASAVFQVLVSVALLALILMHSGRDAGLGGMGFTPASQGGTHIVERNLTRLTVVVATVFFLNSVLLYRLLA